MDRSRYRGALLGVLVGDALGAPFEGHLGTVPEAVFAEVASRIASLQYTDDTAMTIAFSESQLRSRGLDEDDLAKSCARHWALDPDRGYSSTTAARLRGIHAGRPWHQLQLRSRPTNGAAMRIAPAALHARGEPVATIELARGSARVTHPHPLAQTYASVQAVAVAAALRHQPGIQIEPTAFVAQITSEVHDPSVGRRLSIASELAARADPDEISSTLGSSILAAESVPAAICAFLCHPDAFKDAVALAIGLGGDTDTIAAMTGAISGAFLGENAIPAAWLSRVDAAARLRALADAHYAGAVVQR
jgi:poly(ADP-ribose) glycohydrolase ARH3